jgi:radical SAM protein with 4Fe4S-binding SPASM domain
MVPKAVGKTPRCRDEELIGSPQGTEDGGRLIGHVQEWAFANVVPLNVSIETTLDCNIRCLHCYNLDRDAPAEVCDSDAADVSPPLTGDEILALMTDLRAAGCLFLSLTGGEVLMHPQLFAFLDHARDLNMAVQLLSNGTLLRPGVAGRLAGYNNLLGVSLSLYGATAAVHDSVTQVSGSWRRTWAGAERLRALGVAVRLKFIVMRGNAHEVAQMRADADARGFAYMVDLTITARHDGSTGSLSTRVDGDQLERLYRGPLHDMIARGGREISEEDFPCNCARGNCAISARGDVYPCVSVPMAAGNIRKQRFQDIWRESPVFQRIRGLAMKDYAQCAPCDHKAFCSRDRGAAYNASGSYTGVDPFVCAGAETAHRIADEERAGAQAPVDDVRAAREPAANLVRLRVAR